jgi:hypothetical protein
VEGIQKNEHRTFNIQHRTLNGKGEAAHVAVFVIPGLIRNPALFQRVNLLDAGSSPA